MRSHRYFIELLLGTTLLVGSAGFSQPAADIIPVQETFTRTDRNTYHPRNFGFLTETPGNISHMSKWSFRSENIKPLIIFGAGTTLLMLFDQPIIDGAEKLFKKLGIRQHEKFYPLLKVGGKEVLKRPGNINSFFYQLGEPSPTFLFAGGFYLYGKLKKDERASRTASEITESFITSIIMVQVLKRVAGRQSPNKATRPGGKWHFFPSWSDYNRDPTSYFSFPSGHMATMMSLTTVIAENYPEKKWIRPVGYSITGLTALSQLNNKVHWASDFLLGLGIGYLSGKIAHRVKVKKKNFRPLSRF